MNDKTPADGVVLSPIAHIRTDFPTKFGVPRQSGLNEALEAEIVFEPEYRSPEALRGLEEFSHIWLIWLFSENLRDGWSPTVRPPRLGGNTRVGVFASRSPFRPNPVGLSRLRLLGIETTRERGPVLRVAGADMVDGTPILDIKPYIPGNDSLPTASGGFTDRIRDRVLSVNFPAELLARVPEDKRAALLAVLSADPRPSYQDDPERLYGFGFAGLEVKFRVEDELLSVVGVD